MTLSNIPILPEKIYIYIFILKSLLWELSKIEMYIPAVIFIIPLKCHVLLVFLGKNDRLLILILSWVFCPPVASSMLSWYVLQVSHWSTADFSACYHQALLSMAAKYDVFLSHRFNREEDQVKAKFLLLFLSFVLHATIYICVYIDVFK